jgi:hypothetical protein
MMPKLSTRRASAAGATVLATVLALTQSGVPAFAGQPAQPQGPALPDLVVGADRMRSTVEIVSRTFSPTSCSVVEGCVVAGSRRLLRFDTQIINQGNADAVLGRPQDRPDLYVFSPCHGHYHMIDVLDYSMAFGGVDTNSVYDATTGTFFVKNKNSSGGADLVFTFGVGGAAIALAGDWDNDGDSTPGLYDPATSSFFLRNSNTGGAADLVFSFGAAGQGYLPIVGDWDGDGDTTIGLYSPATGAFFLKNTNAAGAADVVFTYGAGGGLTAIAGDWDGNDTDTVGLYSETTGAFFLKNANAGGAADLVFSFGPGGGLRAVAGDWNADGVDTIGVYDTATGGFFIRNQNSGGGADESYTFGAGGASVSPVAGDFDYDQEGPTVPGIVGLKQAFCWLDSQRVYGTLPSRYNCSNQGITQGWSDVYGRTLDCQYVDITGLAAGNYQLRASVNDTQVLVTESDYSNNSSAAKVRITSATSPVVTPSVRITSNFAGRTLKAGKPVTITWEIENGEGIETQEVWFVPSPKKNHPGHDEGEAHDAALAQWKMLAEKLSPTTRSFTWTPTEDFVFDYHARFLVRTNNTHDMVGTDTLTKGRFRVKK